MDSSTGIYTLYLVGKHVSFLLSPWTQRATVPRSWGYRVAPSARVPLWALTYGTWRKALRQANRWLRRVRRCFRGAGLDVRLPCYGLFLNFFITALSFTSLLTPHLLHIHFTLICQTRVRFVIKTQITHNFEVALWVALWVQGLCKNETLFLIHEGWWFSQYYLFSPFRYTPEILPWFAYIELLLAHAVLITNRASGDLSYQILPRSQKVVLSLIYPNLTSRRCLNVLDNWSW